MADSKQKFQKNSEAKQSNFESGYLVVFIFMLLSVITVTVAVFVYKNSQKIVIDEEISLEVKSLPETGDIAPSKDLQFTCDRYSEGKLQVVDGIKSRCIDSMWITISE